MNYQIEVRLIGDDLTPNKISSRDVGELITAIEQMIAAVVAQDNPALGIKEDEVIVGLSGVEKGSYILQFESLYEIPSQNAYQKIAEAVVTGKYDNLPIHSIEAIRTTRKIARTYKTETQFWEKNGQYRQLATIAPNTEIDVILPTIAGKTTLYGYIIGIMGSDPPRVHLRLISGEKIICNVTRKNNLQVARQLGQSLYTNVGVRGTATWYISDMSIKHFLVEEMTPYKGISVKEALENLNEYTGENYRYIDIEELVADLRGNNEDY